MFLLLIKLKNFLLLLRKQVVAIVIIFTILYGAYCLNAKYDLPIFKSTAVELKACNALGLPRNRSRKFDFNQHSFQRQCYNILENITDGYWVINEHYDKTELQHLLFLQNKFRQHLDMPAKLWRSDGKCGSDVAIHKGSSFASICDPNGLSCCTDYERGYCVQSDSSSCQCNRCFDSAKLLFPSFSKWITTDKMCKWKNYTALKACTLLNNMFATENNIEQFVSPHFYFFGDSLVHNMFLGLLVLLSGRRNTGTWKNCLEDDKIKKLCYGPNQLYYMPCLTTATSSEIDQVDDGLMCGNMGRYFNVSFKSFFATSFKDELLQYVSQLLDKPNTVVTVGIGILEKCRSEIVLENYLKPLVQLVKTSTTGWPKLLWVHPLKLGSVVSKQFWSGVGNDDVEAFTQNIDQYLKEENIPAFNFQKLTTNVHSHDGTHYGVGLNLMKIQIWLNYLASIGAT